MRRIAGLVLVLLVSAGAAAAAAPRIAVDLQVYNYPDTVSGIAVVHDFTLSNVGDQDLVIARVQTSCGCTTTQLGQSVLAPGQSVSLRVVFDTTEYWGGGIRREITVYSNDPYTPSFVLTLSGRILPRETYQESIVQFVDQQACVFLDVREPSTYAAGHLLGAMNVPASQAGTLAAGLPPSALFYCYADDRTAAQAAAAALRSAGLGAARVVCDGLGTWGQHRPWSSLLTPGTDTSWGHFLDVSGARGSFAGSLTDCTSITSTKHYVLIDLRSPASFAQKHLAGALNLAESSALSFAMGLQESVPVVLYSDDGAASDRLAETLSSRGRNATSLLGGLDEWQKMVGNFLLVASSP